MEAEIRTFEGRCSFCRKSNAEVDVLIASIGAFICNECVGVANDVLARTPAGGRQGRDHVGETMRGAATAKLLELVAGVEPLVEDVTAYQVFGVAVLRDRGVSWADIGRALGVTRQAAWKRFARGPESE
jgi:hypothetical protein